MPVSASTIANPIAVSRIAFSCDRFKPPVPLPAEQSADRAADRADWTTNPATAVATTTMPMTVLPRSAALFQECRMLRGIKEAGFGIPAFFLPTSDGGPGRFFELAVDLDAKPERE